MIIRKKYLFYVLAVTSSLIAAAVTAVDSFVGGQPAFKYDPWAFAFSLFFIGAFITLLITIVLSSLSEEKASEHTFLTPRSND